MKYRRLSSFADSGTDPFRCRINFLPDSLYNLVLVIGSLLDGQVFPGNPSFRHTLIEKTVLYRQLIPFQDISQFTFFRRPDIIAFQLDDYRSIRLFMPQQHPLPESPFRGIGMIDRLLEPELIILLKRLYIQFLNLTNLWYLLQLFINPISGPYRQGKPYTNKSS